MADNEREQRNGGAMKGKTCACGCDGCGCTNNGGWGYGYRRFGGGFWFVRIILALVVAAIVFCAGLFIGAHVGVLRAGYGPEWMMPYGDYGYYGRAYPGGMMGGYGYYGGGAPIPPVPANGATGAAGPATSTLK